MKGSEAREIGLEPGLMAQMPQEVEGIAVYHQLCRQDAEVAAKQCRVYESCDGLDSSVDVAVDVLDIQVSNLGIVSISFFP